MLLVQIVAEAEEGRDRELQRSVGVYDAMGQVVVADGAGRVQPR